MTQEKCKYTKHCSGCQLQNLDYPAQLELKQKKLRRLFAGYGVPRPIIGMEQPLHYRNKCQFSFRTGKKKEILYGLYQSKTKSVTPVSNCMLDHPKADAIAATVSKLAKSFKLSVYDYHQQKGFLRHVLVRTGHFSQQIMVVLVTSSPIFPKKQQFISALLSRHPEITTIVLSISESEKMTLGRRQDVLYGTGTITDRLLDKEFVISPASFYQINTVQTERLYQHALGYACLNGTQVLIDAYCGTGTIGLLAADQVKKVLGVELNASAIRDAKENAARNQIKNAHFICADAADIIAEMAKVKEKADVVILDPPRAGSTKKCLSALLKLTPQRIIYISCNPETQVRDLGVLTKGGYQVQTIQGFDLFPMTNHIECVVLMSKVEK